MDSHAHLVFAGERSAEFAARMAGTPYQAGGIRSTVAATRARPDELLRGEPGAGSPGDARPGDDHHRMQVRLRADVSDEVRASRWRRRSHPKSLSCGRMSCRPSTPETGRLRGSGLRSHADACAPLARWVDVFCERGAFDADQASEVLAAGPGRAAAPGARNQLGPGPGVQVAVAAGAASADHCTYLSDGDVEALGVDRRVAHVATLLPGVEFSTRRPYPDARRLRDAGVTVALATDCNPGSSFTTNMPCAWPWPSGRCS